MLRVGWGGVFTGLLLRDLNEVTSMGESYELLYITMMVTHRLNSLAATQSLLREGSNPHYPARAL